jgi:hypothetical protein
MSEIGGKQIFPFKWSACKVIEKTINYLSTMDIVIKNYNKTLVKNRKFYPLLSLNQNIYWNFNIFHFFESDVISNNKIPSEVLEMPPREFEA